jgi:hypothetical protein
MARMFPFAGTCVLLCSFVAFGIGAGPAGAVTYLFTADAKTNAGTKDFSVQYTDTDLDGLLDENEVIPGTFSGAWVLDYDGVYYLYPNLDKVPIHDAGKSKLTDGTGYFFSGPFIEPGWYFSGGAAPSFGNAVGTYARYYKEDQKVVPIPGSLLLLGSALIPLVWARRKKRLGK